MKNLVIIFAIALLAVFGIGAAYYVQSNKSQSQGNPYNKENLNPETIKLLDNENYLNIILPDELDAKLASNGTFVTYFFSPLCDHCMETTPIMMPVAKKMGISVHQYNLLEYDFGWQKYGIEESPALVVYKDGQEVTRVTGNIGEEGFETFFDQWVLN